MYRYIDLQTKDEVDRVLEDLKDTVLRDTTLTLAGDVSTKENGRIVLELTF